MKNRYRIVDDDYLGYEVQVKKWWFPFMWSECCDGGPSNTHSSLAKAKRFAERQVNGNKRKVYAEYDNDDLRKQS